MRKLSPSTLVFIALVVLNAILAAIASFLPQGVIIPGAEEVDIPLIQIAVFAAGMILFIYGGLGFVGLRLSRKLGFPDLLDAKVTTRQRFVIPCITGLWLGLIFIVADNIFARFHSYGPLPHPPFPTSLLASFTAGIGEEMVFRLFFISLLVWLISRVVLKGQQETIVYWNAAIFSAVFFAAGHLPTVMLLLGVDTPSAIPQAVMAEVFLLNGAISLVAAYFMRRSGYLAAVTVHTSADLVWHVIWGLLR